MKRVSGVLMRPIYFSFPREGEGELASFWPFSPLSPESPFSQLKTNGQTVRESNRNWGTPKQVRIRMLGLFFLSRLQSGT